MRVPKRIALVVTAVLLGLTFVGGGTAQAAHCAAMPSDPGNVNLDVGGLAKAGMDQDDIATDHWGIYVCTWNVQTGHAVAGVHLMNADPGRPGTQASLDGCTETSCPVAVSWTGAEVGTPTTTLDLPGGGSVGGSAGTGAGTCVYDDGTSTCPPPAPIVGVTVAENDVAPHVGIAGLPTGVDTDTDPGRATVVVTVGSFTHTENLPPGCVGVCI